MTADAYTSLDIADILDALPFYVMLVDETHHILQANRATREHLGLSPQMIVGKYCPEAIHGTKEPWYACPLEEALEKDRPVEREALDRQSGRWIRSAVYPIGKKGPSGRRIFFHMVSDISDRKQAEEQAETARFALKAFAAHLVNAQEEERRRIARELHDQTIQKVVFLGRQLESLSCRGDLSSSASLKLREAKDINGRVAADLRSFAKDLRPPALDDLGLVDSVNKLLLDLSDRTGIQGSLKLVGEERRLPPETEVGIFRIVQEAFRNIERHSKATEVAVTIEFQAAEMILSVVDNGEGFDIASARQNLAASHFGLVGMQERAELAGGKLEVHSSAQRGSTITVTVPT